MLQKVAAEVDFSAADLLFLSSEGRRTGTAFFRGLAAIIAAVLCIRV